MVNVEDLGSDVTLMIDNDLNGERASFPHEWVELTFSD
jgi:hypothetical protein